MPYVSIVGSAGYTGQETLDRVLRHPELELYAVGSDSLAGRDATALDPRLNRNGGKRVPRLITNAAALACEADVTFLCLPHEEAAEFEPPARGVVVDLSGAHRLADPTQYEAWYGFTHPRPEGLGGWSYGLPELSPPEGRLVANPGCYATAVLLALGPIAAAVDPGSVVVDAMSGMTGAGRSPRPSTHAGSVLENVSPYKVGAHQHVAEIAQVLGFPVSFTPHLLPVRRGLLATCNVRSTGSDLRALLEEHYAASPVVTVLREGVTPELARVQHTDGAEIGVFGDRHTDRTIVICALDNLGKGAAGQAVQNVNALFGLGATTGLRLAGVLV
ncbi:MAG TPA: N-acetyl-gamma-glutamyl-phosphate reductase [Gaiella sp.]|uniref:N-acetyl-gamma-glutamyl-phosphate reductase n=1 Tax=Gaiella sp. TaxID=2663207 RepID=UPI002D80DDED|nr:N-acetyl-gamma-glutamyl-phosphate reductase [Gaiella sp.]HET9285956.1 N-acetyl-gamma-glutamyl-phosphate reductase [Gaiella sp.]